MLEIVTKKISKNEARKLYENFTESKVIELSRAKSSRGKNKRLNILNIYNNVKSSIFEGIYFNYSNESVITEENIADNAQLRKKRLDIIDKKKENINNALFNHYFDYLNQDIMIKNLKMQVMKQTKIW